MTEIERLALTTAFVAAVVVGGLSLSLVPAIEVVTLIVFSSGILLGARGGTLVGVLGMPLYVFTNAAWRGFAPSPLPLLLVQAVGMGLAGFSGGLWRGAWLRGGRPRRGPLIALPLIGLVLTFLYQLPVNAVSAFLFTTEGSSRWAMFVSGMMFVIPNHVANAILFGVGGPQAAFLLRRTARRRGWWLPGALAAAALVVASPLFAQDGGEADSLDLAAAAARPGDELQELGQGPIPLWRVLPHHAALEWGATRVVAGAIPVPERARTTAPAFPPTLDRWALGWGRVRATYDGIPLDGPVHGLGEPPDLPLAWPGELRTRWVATGTTVDVVPPARAGVPRSQVSLLTGSLARRRSEFLIHRQLGGIDASVVFLDRDGNGRLLLQDIDQSRAWFRFARREGLTRWSLDVSTGTETRSLFDEGRYRESTRRVLATVRGRAFGQAGRLSLMLRRQALSATGSAGDFGEIVLDGYTAQGDWLVPGLGVTGRVRWDRDRRRGGLDEPATFDGVRLLVEGHRGDQALGLAFEAQAGHQEPFGFTRGGALQLSVEESAWSARIALSHEEERPSLVVGVDRPTPETGMTAYLQRFESDVSPERRSALRAEVTWSLSRLHLSAGGWIARLDHYRLDSNPLWAAGSPYEPLSAPLTVDDFTGVHGSARLDLGRGWSAQGRGRAHDRELEQVPYLARWLAEGSLHWRRWWFDRSIDLDIALGGTVLGPRMDPDQESFPTAGVGYLRLRGQIDRGVLTVSFENLADAFLEADLRDDTLGGVLPVAGRTVAVGLTLYLEN